VTFLDASERVSHVLERYAEQAPAEGGRIVGGLGFLPGLGAVHDIVERLLQFHLDRLIGVGHPS
jgi:hypothetical protein